MIIFNSSTNLRAIRNKKRTLTESKALKLKGMGNKIKSANDLSSIFKGRLNKIDPSDKKISFGDVKKLEYYFHKK